MALTAPPGVQRELLRLQELDTRIGRLAAEAQNPPENAELAALAPGVEAARARQLSVSGERDDAAAELRRIESDVDVVEARVQRDSTRLQATSSVKDVQALESELAALALRRSDLEDMELAVMERIEELDAQLAAAEADRGTLTEREDALRRARGDRLDVLERERAAAAADRATVSATIPAELLALYDRQRLRYGIGAARLVRGVSLGSNVKLAPSDLATVRAAADDEVVLCPDSGCILIRDEESGL